MIGKDSIRLASKTMSVSLLVETVCNAHHISTGELRSGNRRQKIVEARLILSWLAVTKLGYSGGEVAHYLGVTPSCKTRAVSSEKGLQAEIIF